MGTWGTGPFENDDAADWVWSLDGASDIAPVVKALQEIVDIDRDDYLDAWDASVGVAAAACLAAAGGAAVEIPDSVNAWLGRLSAQPGAEERELARGALQRIRTAPSELLELWEEAGVDEWLERIGALDTALAP